MKYLPTLDGWRTVAILGVVISHCFASSSPFAWIAWRGAIGVNLFFAISGLLICSRIVLDEERDSRIDLKAFYIRRFFRIIPPAFSYLFVLLILQPWFGFLKHPGLEVSSCVFFFRNFIDLSDWYTAHFWSLAVEEHFYLLLPFLLIITPKSRRSGVLIFLAIAFTVWKAIALSLLHVTNDYRTDMNLFGLLWGCVAALTVMTNPEMRGHVAVWTKGWPTLALVALGAILTLWVGPIAAALRGPVFPAMMLATVLNVDSPVSRFLEWPPMRTVGQTSYGIYLWQQLFTYRGTGKLFIQRFPLNIVLLLALCWLSYRFFEKPLVQYARRLTSLPKSEKEAKITAPESSGPKTRETLERP